MILHCPSLAPSSPYTPRILLWRKSRIRIRMAVLAELGNDRRCRRHRYRYLHQLVRSSTSSSQIFPSGFSAFIVVVVTVALNLISVKLFGELEFWFASLRFLPCCPFMAVGIWYLVFGEPINGVCPGLNLVRPMTASSPTVFFPLLSWFRGVCSPTPVLSWSAPPVGETKNVEGYPPRCQHRDLAYHDLLRWFRGSALA